MRNSSNYCYKERISRIDAGVELCYWRAKPSHSITLNPVGLKTNWALCWYLKNIPWAFICWCYIYIYICPSFIQFSLSAALKEKIYQHIREKFYQQIPRQINNVICQQEKNLQKRNLPAISCKSSKIFKKNFKINQNCSRNLPAIKKKKCTSNFWKRNQEP